MQAGGLSAVDRLRVRFRKGGDLRLLSHHDLLRCFERMFRRAALPVHLSHGFHPHPRFVFALSLPLGVVGCAEVMDLELDEVLPVDEVRERLARQCPPGLAILSVERVPLKASLQVRSLCYRLAIPSERIEPLKQKIAELLATTSLPIKRTKTQPDAEGPVRAEGISIDLRPFLRDLRVIEAESRVEIDLWLTPAGTAKPVEILGLLGLMDLIDAGAVIERSRLELQDSGQCAVGSVQQGTNDCPLPTAHCPLPT